MIYAGFFRRAVALIVDTLIVLVPTLLIFGPVLAGQVFSLGVTPSELSAAQASLMGATLLSWQLVIGILLWLYFAWFESSSKQATWGKQLLGIKVVDKNGQRISFARATGRFFGKILSYVIFYIGFIMAAFTNRKRALHDIIVETYVVKKSYEEGQPLPATSGHPFLLVLVSAIWILLLISGLFWSASLSITPTQAVAQQAAQRLRQLSADHTRFADPMRLEGMTLFYTPEGYRAVVVDPASNNKFTLLLPRGGNQVCCQVFPQGNCESTGFESCTE